MTQSINLPDNATEASLRRAEIARVLLESCPPTLADEIALVGSTARGAADDDSDLELNLWAQAIPPRVERVGWLRATGATDVQVEDEPRPDDSHWIKFRLDDVPAEVGWQTFHALHAQIERIRSGEALERKALTFGDVIASAIPLRGDQLPTWQTVLADYSDAVQRGIVRLAVEQWSQPKRWATAYRLARHGERLTLTAQLLDDLDVALRLLYAVNRRWEPSAKWTLTVAQNFASDDLNGRIDAVLGAPSLERRVELCAQFCHDVLALVPNHYDVAAAINTLNLVINS